MQFTDKQTLEYLYVEYVVTCDIPFLQVQHTSFRRLLEYINPIANDQLPDSHSTIQARVMSLHAEGKKRVTIILQAIISSIHLTYDAWTLPNHRALFAIVAHFISEEGRLQKMLLSLQEPI